MAVAVKAEGVTLREPTGYEALRYRIHGARLMGFFSKPGWRGELPYYSFRCSVHGFVENYPQGFRGELRCPRCQAKAEELLDPSNLK